LKERLTTEPARVLQEHGIALPPDAEVRVIETTPSLLYLFLPPRPPNMRELTATDLSSVVGGTVRKSGGDGTGDDFPLTTTSGTSTSSWSCLIF